MECGQRNDACPQIFVQSQLEIILTLRVILGAKKLVCKLDLVPRVENPLLLLIGFKFMVVWVGAD